MSVQWTGCQDDTELWAGPLDFPYGGALDFDAALLDPSLGAFLVDFDIFVTAGCCDSLACPVKAKVMNDYTGWKLCNDIDFVFLDLHLVLIIEDRINWFGWLID